MTKPTIKFVNHGVKVDNVYFSCFVSATADASATFYNAAPGPAVCFSLKGGSLPETAGKLLSVQNNTDSQSDYFDCDRFRVTPASPYWTAAVRLYLKTEAAALEASAKRNAKVFNKYNADALASDRAKFEAFKMCVALLAPRPQYAGAGPLAEPATVTEVLAALEPDPRAYEGTPVYSWGRDLPEPTDTDEAPDWAAFV